MYSRLLIVLLTFAMFAAVSVLLKRRQMALATRASEQSRKPDIPTIVYFWANGCPVCKMTQKKILDDILAEFGGKQLTLTAYNTDEVPDAAKKWGVRTLPTTFVLDSTGAIKHVNNGLATAETLRSQVASVM